MANLFEEGAASSINNLLSLLGAFASSVAGFTYTVGVGKGNNGQDIHYLRKNGMTYMLEESDLPSANEIWLHMTPTAPDETGWDWDDVLITDSPRYVSRAGLFTNVGPYVKRWFYTDANKQCVHVVLEVNAGQFTHFSFGLLNKNGAWVGGEYTACGSYSTSQNRDINYSLNRPCWPGYNKGGNPGGYVRRPVGGNDLTDYANFGSESDEQMALGSTTAGVLEGLISNSPSEVALRAALFPQYIWLKETSEDLWWPAGEVPGVRVVNIRDHQPKDIVLTDWQLFPLTDKNGTDPNVPNSYNYGLAYERVVE